MKNLKRFFAGLPSWLPWSLMAILVAVFLSVGILDNNHSLTDAERVNALSSSIRCPQCQGETVAESNVALASAIRADLRERVDEGQSDNEIRQAYVGLYGESVLLTPPGEGISVLLWIVPIAGGAVATAILLLAWRWRSRMRLAMDLPGAPVSPAISDLPPSPPLVSSGLPPSPPLVSSGLPPSPPPDSPRFWRRKVLVTVGIVLVVAVTAGFFVARSAGFRTSSDEATGDIRQSTRGILVSAEELIAQGELPAAIAEYNLVLEAEPSNVVALTYKGWLLWLTQDTQAVSQAGLQSPPPAADSQAETASQSPPVRQSEQLLSDAVAIDPEYPDARVFRAIIFARTSRWEAASAELQVLDSLNPAEQLLAFVNASNIRVDISQALLEMRIERVAVDMLALADDLEAAGESLSLDGVAEALSEYSEREIYNAALSLINQGEARLPAAMFSYLLSLDADNILALAGRGYLYTLPELVQFPEVFEVGIADLDRVLELEPNNDNIRLLRARALITAEVRLVEAQSDIDSLLGLTELEAEVAMLQAQLDALAN